MDKKRIGQIGEDAACEYYKRHGFRLIDRNFRKPFGEIDIIVEKAGVLVFVEVKSASCVSFQESRQFNPLENMHKEKQRRLRKIISFYKSREGRGYEDWRCDVALVWVNVKERISRVSIFENIILGEG